MIKKLHFFFSFLLFSSFVFAQQDSVRIEKAVLLFYDSTEIVPVVNKIPFDETGQTAYLLNYENLGSQDLFNYTVKYEVYHVTDSWGSPGIGLVSVNDFSRDSLLVGEHRKEKIQSCTVVPTMFGDFRIDFKILNSSNVLLDSTSFYFEVGDTIMSKSNEQLPTSKTGPGFFQDSNLNQVGGFAIGDRFGTLFEINKKNASSQLYFPTSVSLYVSADTSNVGAEIAPMMWEANLDSSQNKLIIGNVVASSFIPTVINSLNLGTVLTLGLDNGISVFNGLNEGKYIVGFQSTLPNPNGKTLILGRDTVGEKLQPQNTSFVYFGHDTNWYAVNDLPMINLNFNYILGGRYVRPCLAVGLERQIESQSDLNIYPNPSTGIFTLENLEVIPTTEVYNTNGQQVNVKLKNNQLDLSEQPTGIYLLRVLLEDGAIVFKKLMKF